MLSETMRLPTDGSTPSSSATIPTVTSAPSCRVCSSTWFRTRVRLRSLAEIGFSTSSSEVRRSLENAGPTASSSSSAVLGSSFLATHASYLRDLSKACVDHQLHACQHAYVEHHKPP